MAPSIQFIETNYALGIISVRSALNLNGRKVLAPRSPWKPTSAAWLQQWLHNQSIGARRLPSLEILKTTSGKHVQESLDGAESQGKEVVGDQTRSSRVCAPSLSAGCCPERGFAGAQVPWAFSLPCSQKKERKNKFLGNSCVSLTNKCSLKTSRMMSWQQWSNICPIGALFGSSGASKWTFPNVHQTLAAPALYPQPLTAASKCRTDVRAEIKSFPKQSISLIALIKQNNLGTSLVFLRAPSALLGHEPCHEPLQGCQKGGLGFSGPGRALERCLL